METVRPSMLDALTHAHDRVQAIDTDMLLCTEELTAPAPPAPLDLPAIHKQACKSIHSMMQLLHRCSLVPHLQTYINVYLLWYACMRAVLDRANQQPQHPKCAFVEYIKHIPLPKLTVLLPAVCFWVSVKCSDSFAVRTRDLAMMMVAVHQERGEHDLVYNLHDLRDTESVMLQLIDFDILKNQDSIDRMEDLLRAQFGAAYESEEAQAQIVNIIFKMFQQVADVI